MGEDLVAALGARRDRRPRHRGSAPARRASAAMAAGRVTGRVDDRHRLDVIGAERARHHDRLLGELVGGVLHEHEHGTDIYSTPIVCRISTTAGAASAPWPRTSACLLVLSRQHQAHHLQLRVRARRLGGRDRLALGPHPARAPTDTAGRLMPSLTETTAGGGTTYTSRPGRGLLLAAHRVAVDGDRLDPVDDRQPQRLGDPDRHLVVAGVGGLVAEQDQVKRLGLGRGSRRRSRPPSPADPIRRRR